MSFLASCKCSLALSLALLLPAAGAVAQWELDNSKSAINFISIKKNAVAETHGFGTSLGYISKSGKVSVDVDLDSVDTAFAIRDERMRALLFETNKFPTAGITAQVEAAVLEALVEGGLVITTVEVSLELHGVAANLQMPVMIIGEPGGTLRVVSRSPVIVNAADFELQKGVSALAQVAGLSAISAAVPVTVNLVFSPASKE